MTENGKLTRLMFSDLEPTKVLNNKNRHAIINLPGTCDVTSIKTKAPIGQDVEKIQAFVIEYRLAGRDDDWKVLQNEKNTRVKVRC